MGSSSKFTNAATGMMKGLVFVALVVLPMSMSAPTVHLKNHPQMAVAEKSTQSKLVLASEVSAVQGNVIAGKGVEKSNCLCVDCQNYKWLPSYTSASTTELRIWRNAKYWFKWYVQLSPHKKNAEECRNMCLAEPECAMSTFKEKANSCWHYNKISATHTAKNKLDRSEKGGPNNNLVCFVKEYDLFHDQQAKAIGKTRESIGSWTLKSEHDCDTKGSTLFTLSTSNTGGNFKEACKEACHKRTKCVGFVFIFKGKQRNTPDRCNLKKSCKPKKTSKGDRDIYMKKAEAADSTAKR